MKHWLLSAYLLVSVATEAQARMPEGEALMQGAHLCSAQFALTENQYQIPTHLLAAIGTIESGVYSSEQDRKLPWPWTVRVRGRGYYFAHKAEAVQKVNALRAAGIKNINVGCMQIDLESHADEFDSTEDALTPASNIEVAAEILKDNFEDTGNWRRAVARYQSRHTGIGSRYVKSVFAQRAKILTP